MRHLHYKVTISDGVSSDILHNYGQTAPKISNGKVAESVNEIPAFDFTVYPDNPCYGDIEPLTTSIKVHDMDKDEELFSGRVLSVTQQMNSDGLIYKDIQCNGELGYLNDTVQEGGSVTSGTHTTSVMSGVLNNHNAESSIKFYNGNVEMGGFPLGVEYEWVSTFKALRYLYVECMGGEIRLRKTEDGTRYIDYAAKFENKSDTPILLGDNLQSLIVTKSATDLITRLYPLGGVMPNGRRLTVAASGQTQGADYIEEAELVEKYGIISGTVRFDDISGELENMPTLALRLWRKGVNYLQTKTIDMAQYTVSVLDLSVSDDNYSQFKLYGVHKLKNKLMDIDDEVRITGRVLNLDEPYRSKLTFGSKQTTLSGLLAKI